MKYYWMPFDIGSYLADTMHLSTRQHGAYLLLIMTYWANGGLPSDFNSWQYICKLSPHEWLHDKEKLREFFDSSLRHKRIDQELAKAEKISQSRSLAGLKSAWKKRNHLTLVEQVPTQLQLHKHKEAFKRLAEIKKEPEKSQNEPQGAELDQDPKNQE